MNKKTQEFNDGIFGLHIKCISCARFILTVLILRNKKRFVRKIESKNRREWKKVTVRWRGHQSLSSRREQLSLFPTMKLTCSPPLSLSLFLSLERHSASRYFATFDFTRRVYARSVTVNFMDRSRSKPGTRKWVDPTQKTGTTSSSPLFVARSSFPFFFRLVTPSKRKVVP